MKPNLTSDVLNAITKFGKSSPSEIAKFVLGNENSVRSSLRRLERKGVIKKSGRGRYIPNMVGEAHTSSISNFYLSGLQYNRDIGIKIAIIGNIDEAEEILRDYAISNISNYNDGFYGIAEIPYSNEVINEVIEVNL